MANPDICHIVFITVDISLSVFEERSNLDRAWNMIALSDVLHDWWRKGLWGFKFIDIRLAGTGIEEVIIVLEFYWMPWKIKDMAYYSDNAKWTDDVKDTNATHASGGKAQPKGQGRNMKVGKGEALVYKWLAEKQELDDGDPPCSWASGATDEEPGEPVHLGNIFEIRLPAADAPKTKAKIDIQWAGVRMASLSGLFDTPAILMPVFHVAACD